MKFRYFLRGLGVGIVFASIIFMIGYDGMSGKNITDAEIMERAKQLGMVEKEDNLGKLINMSSETEDAATESSAEEKTTEEKTTEKKTTEEKTTEEKTTEEKTTEEKTTEKKTTEEKTTEKKTTEEKTTEKKTTEERTTEEKTTESANKNYELVVSPGDSSFPICQKLQEMGLVKNAEEFDDYLIEHGYATRISVGTHKLRKGMSYKEIAIAISDKF